MGWGMLWSGFAIVWPNGKIESLGLFIRKKEGAKEGSLIVKPQFCSFCFLMREISESK